MKHLVNSQGPHRPALGQEQRRSEEATRGPQNRARSTPHPKDRWRSFVQTPQDVRILLYSPLLPPLPSTLSPKAPIIKRKEKKTNLKPPFLRNCSHDLRKSIARVLTVINSNQRQQLRLFYAKKKYLPLDLRPKKTRAIRRRLSRHEATIVTEKQKKKSTHFPQRKYAVKVCGDFYSGVEYLAKRGFCV